MELDQQKVQEERAPEQTLHVKGTAERHKVRIGKKREKKKKVPWASGCKASDLLPIRNGFGSDGSYSWQKAVAALQEHGHRC